MGCKSHMVRGVEVRFSEVDDNWACLCTYELGDATSVLRMRSLAAFGASVLAILKGDGRDGGYWHIPGDLPQNFIADLDGILPISPEDR